MSGKHDNAAIVSADAQGIAAAVAWLQGGGLVAVPTETVYGLAARADSAEAVAAIYRTKGRPDFNPLIVHVAGIDQAETIAVLDDRARALAALAPQLSGEERATALAQGLATALAIQSKR